MPLPRASAARHSRKAAGAQAAEQHRTARLLTAAFDTWLANAAQQATEACQLSAAQQHCRKGRLASAFAGLWGCAKLAAWKREAMARAAVLWRMRALRAAFLSWLTGVLWKQQRRAVLAHATSRLVHR